MDLYIAKEQVSDELLKKIDDIFKMGHKVKLVDGLEMYHFVSLMDSLTKINQVAELTSGFDGYDYIDGETFVHLRE